jgi:hypothetical protein
MARIGRHSLNVATGRPEPFHAAGRGAQALLPVRLIIARRAERPDVAELELELGPIAARQDMIHAGGAWRRDIGATDNATPAIAAQCGRPNGTPWAPIVK